jgi:hypothetical protein
MSPVTASLDRGFGTGSLTPPEINALLFYRLSQFVVWGQEHRDLAAAHSDLAALLETATRALSRGGIREPEGWVPTGDPTLRHCAVCRLDTLHQVHRFEGSLVRVCTRCFERSLCEAAAGVESAGE